MRRRRPATSRGRGRPSRLANAGVTDERLLAFGGASGKRLPFHSVGGLILSGYDVGTPALGDRGGSDAASNHLFRTHGNRRRGMRR